MLASTVPDCASRWSRDELVESWTIPEFVKLAATITRFLPLITNTLVHGMSNARSGATVNTHLRAPTKRSHGYHSPGALIAMRRLTRGGRQLELPGRK